MAVLWGGSGLVAERVKTVRGARAAQAAPDLRQTRTTRPITRRGRKSHEW